MVNCGHFFLCFNYFFTYLILFGIKTLFWQNVTTCLVYFIDFDHLRPLILSFHIIQFNRLDNLTFLTLLESLSTKVLSIQSLPIESIPQKKIEICTITFYRLRFHCSHFYQALFIVFAKTKTLLSYFSIAIFIITRAT